MDDVQLDLLVKAVVATLKATTKKEGDGDSHPRSHYLVVEDPEKSSTWHLRVKDDNGYNRNLCGAAWAALHGGYRGNTYQGPNKAEALKKLTSIYHSQGWDLPGEEKSETQKATTMTMAPCGNPDCGNPNCTCGSSCTCNPASSTSCDEGMSAATTTTQKATAFMRFDKAQPAARQHGVIIGTVSSLRADSEQDAVADQFELEAAAIRFMERQAVGKARATNTHGPTVEGTWVASWPFEPGMWRAAFKPKDPAIAAAAARGEFVGFSIGGSARREDD